MSAFYMKAWKEGASPVELMNRLEGAKLNEKTRDEVKKFIVKQVKGQKIPSSLAWVDLAYVLSQAFEDLRGQCPNLKVLNTKTGRCVSIKGPIGQRILSASRTSPVKKIASKRKVKQKSKTRKRATKTSTITTTEESTLPAPTYDMHRVELTLPKIADVKPDVEPFDSPKMKEFDLEFEKLIASLPQYSKKPPATTTDENDGFSDAREGTFSSEEVQQLQEDRLSVAIKAMFDPPQPKIALPAKQVQEIMNKVISKLQTAPYNTIWSAVQKVVSAMQYLLKSNAEGEFWAVFAVMCMQMLLTMNQNALPGFAALHEILRPLYADGMLVWVNILYGVGRTSQRLGPSASLGHKTYSYVYMAHVTIRIILFFMKSFSRLVVGS